MSERRRGLGRGLGALIPNAPTEETAEQQTGADAPPATGPELRAGSPAGAPAGPVHGAAPVVGTDEAAATVEPGIPGSAGNATADARPRRFGAEETPAQQDSSPAASTPERVVEQQVDESPGDERLNTGTTDSAAADTAATDTETTDAEAAGRQEPPGSRSGSEPARPTGASRNRSAGPAARQKAMKARMDMGEALRGTALGTRPSDMFFVPSAPDGPAAETANGGDGERRNGQRSRRSGSENGVSRETDAAVDPASEQSGTAASTPESGVPEGDKHDFRLSDEVPRETSPEEEELATVPGATFAEVPVDAIHPNRKQPRQVFDEEELAELAYSIGALGVLQPIVVRPSRESGDTAYELVMGERRWRAAQRAGLEAIPAIVRETKDDSLLRDALLENLHRSQLNPLEEAAAYQQLMEEFGATQEELSRRIGRSRPQISNTIRLLRLPPLVQRRVAAGVLSSGHARALLSLSDPAEMERLAQRIVAEGLSVRATEEAVQLAEGTERTPKRATLSGGRHQERLDYIADAFADRLDTSVKIALGARKGKMTIEFASVDDLNRIIEVLDPGMERG